MGGNNNNYLFRIYWIQQQQQSLTHRGRSAYFPSREFNSNYDSTPTSWGEGYEILHSVTTQSQLSRPMTCSANTHSWNGDYPGYYTALRFIPAHKIHLRMSHHWRHVIPTPVYGSWAYRANPASSRPHQLMNPTHLLRLPLLTQGYNSARAVYLGL